MEIVSTPAVPHVPMARTPETVARDIVRRSEAIRPPAGLIRLDARLRSGQTSASELARLIDGSPALAVRLLRMANSAFYSPVQPIVSLSRALVVIGDAVLGQLVAHAIVTSRRAARQTPDQALASARLMSDGVRAAVTARALAHLGAPVVPEEAFTAGLLYDLGHVLLLDTHPAAYSAYLLEHWSPVENLDRELELTGTSHEHVGRALASDWNLPASVGQALADHHRPSEVAISSVVRVADHLVRDRHRPKLAEALPGVEDPETLMAALGVNPAAWAGRTAVTQREMAELLQIFDLAA